MVNKSIPHIKEDSTDHIKQQLWHNTRRKQNNPADQSASEARPTAANQGRAKAANTNFFCFYKSVVSWNKSIFFKPVDNGSKVIQLYCSQTDKYVRSQCTNHTQSRVFRDISILNIIHVNQQITVRNIERYNSYWSAPGQMIYKFIWNVSHKNYRLRNLIWNSLFGGGGGELFVRYRPTLLKKVTKKLTTRKQSFRIFRFLRSLFL